MVEQRWVSGSGADGAAPRRLTRRRWSGAAVIVSVLLTAGARSSDAAEVVVPASAGPVVAGGAVAPAVVSVEAGKSKPSKGRDAVPSDLGWSGSKWSGSAWSGSKWS